LKTNPETTIQENLREPKIHSLRLVALNSDGGTIWNCRNRCGGQQELFAARVFFGEDGVVVIEGVEHLRELEGVFGGVGWLGSGDALLDD
jgi:hypothetical protein